jgi:hypothetical protein
MSNLVEYVVEYAEWQEEEFQRDQKRAEKSKQGKYPKYDNEGKLRVRFLPPRIGEPRFVEVFQHMYKNEDGDFIKYVCPEKAGERDCADCARARKLFATGNKVDERAAREFLPRKRIFANGIDRDDEMFGPKVFELRSAQYDALLKIRGIVGDLTHPEKGYDITLTKTGKGFDTEYGAINAGQQTVLGDMGWITRQEDIRLYAQVPTPEELEKLGVSSVEESDDYVE